jgi:tRNA(Ile2) C34 agmatinyltransferase TiaS
VSRTADQSRRYEVECPHCHKSFTSEPLAGPTERHAGFKCPHCRLFVPFERVSGAERAAEPG